MVQDQLVLCIHVLQNCIILLYIIYYLGANGDTAMYIPRVSFKNDKLRLNSSQLAKMKKSIPDMSLP